MRRSRGGKRPVIHPDAADPMSTIVHELGHVMESHSPELLNRAAEWGRWRIAMGWWRMMRRDDSFRGYAFKAFFYNENRRVYGTEAVTMGNQHMWEYPGTFARLEPEWRQWIYANVLRR